LGQTDSGMGGWAGFASTQEIGVFNYRLMIEGITFEIKFCGQCN
jgi:hypothetical protein